MPRFAILFRNCENDEHLAEIIDACSSYDALIALGQIAATRAGITEFDRPVRASDVSPYSKPPEIVVRSLDEVRQDAKLLIEEDDVLLAEVHPCASSLAATHVGISRGYQARADSVRDSKRSQEERERQEYLRLRARFEPERSDLCEEVDVCSPSSSPAGCSPTRSAAT